MTPPAAAPTPHQSTYTSYQLIIELSQPVRCCIGRLGEFDFPAGRYCYTGSARRAFEARIARHLRQEKTLRWHIDHLLAAPGVSVVKVLRSRRDECELNQSRRGTVPVPGFGASDCRAGCGAHLKRLGAWRPLAVSRQHSRQG